jgi:type IV secretion system protein VirB1
MKKGMGMLRFACIYALVCMSADAQLNAKLDRSQIRSLAERCAPKVHPDTIEAVIRQESAYYPYSLSINYPKTEAARQGYANGLYQLARQPKTLHEAVTWTRWLLQNGHTVSIGLMQVNSEQASKLGIKDLRLLYDPCVNVAAGAVILQESFRGQPSNLDGLAHAFAVYNAGSPQLGTENGYAAGVIGKAPPLTRTSPESSPFFQSHSKATSPDH